MTSPSDLVAPNLIARIAVAIAAGKTIENNWPVTLMQECWDAIEQLQAELAEARDAGIVLKEERESALESARFWEKEESRIHSAMQGEHDALRAELAAVKAQVEIIRDKLVSTELLEALAAVEHNRWAGWMRYQETASAERRADWPRKAGLAYSQLTHDEQESDREEVRTTLAIIEDSLNAALSAARAQAGGK